MTGYDVSLHNPLLQMATIKTIVIFACTISTQAKCLEKFYTGIEDKIVSDNN